MGVVLIAVVVAAIFTGAGFFLRKFLFEAKLASLEKSAKDAHEEAAREIETLRRTAEVEAREKLQQFREQAENELKQRRAEILKGEQRLEDKERFISERDRDIQRREQSLSDREANNKKLGEELQLAIEANRKQLEQVSGLTSTQAKELLLKQIEEETRHDMAKLIRGIEEEARRESDRRARNILSLSIQRTAANHAAETTVSVVPLPSDEMKGRIIGREGRNIRALENISGIDVIIDDTPEAVVLSGFDGVKREIARLTLTKLLADGRIHPTRI